MGVTIKAPAKLNLRLKVTGRRRDGYHELVSVMVPVNLYDRIEINEAPSGISFSSRGLAVPGGEDNLAYRAARAFLERAGTGKGVSIRLFKNIPVASGLGGGSSDAASTLKGLNRMFSGPLSDPALQELALGLGADVPFFLEPRPCVARGIGEILEPVEIGEEFWYVIVHPPVLVSTAWAYQNLKLELTRGEYEYTLKLLKDFPLGLTQILENDLERVTSRRFPVIQDIKARLREAGAEGALMTGSGPTVFGLFQTESQARAAQEFLGPLKRGDIFVAGCWKGVGVSSSG